MTLTRLNLDKNWTKPHYQNNNNVQLKTTDFEPSTNLNIDKEKFFLIRVKVYSYFLISTNALSILENNQSGLVIFNFNLILNKG